ncbi:MAG: molybdopterin molybdotransferase MoeA [Epsilonproteobacteria bacterium]|nr:molybdopterin molybdotransferase MoeA [Campylobacterota bacterium]
MTYITYSESLKNLYKSFEAPTLTEKVFLNDALGRTLASDIIADHNSPELPTSAMDGYAIKYDDQMLERIRITGALPAGTYGEEEIVGGQCIKTFTGSLMSPGTDTLIPIENVKVEEDEIVILESVPQGFSVRPIGENYQEGETLIPKGTKIDFAEIGVLASLNTAQVEVFKKPRVAIVATGSEILDVGEKQTNPSQIRSSNQFTLEALAQKSGALTQRAPLQKDEKEIIQQTITDALADNDIVVTTGGVSVGDYDFVKDIIAGFEPEYITQGVMIKPGQHIKIVKIGQKYIFALPGFPYSSTVTFILYVLPLIYHLQGLDKSLPIVQAKLTQPYKKKSYKTEFAAVNLHFKEGQYEVDFKGKRSGSSAILTNMLGHIGLIQVDKDSTDLKVGDMVEVINLKAL